jgi:hypothetical protein
VYPVTLYELRADTVNGDLDGVDELMTASVAQMARPGSARVAPCPSSSTI